MIVQDRTAAKRATLDVLGFGAGLSVRLGESKWLHGLGDGTDGWRPRRTLFLHRAWMSGLVSVAVPGNAVRLRLYKNGSDAGDVVFEASRVTSPMGWFLTQHVTNVIVRPSDFLLVRLYMTTALNAAVTDIRPHFEGYYV